MHPDGFQCIAESPRIAWRRYLARIPQHRSQAFTLIEVLVGFAVLAAVVTLLLSVFSNFSQITSTSNRRIETNKQPRAMFDRMAFDIGSAVSSGGVNIVFKKNEALPSGTSPKNDALILLTDAKNRDPQSRMAKIGYSVGPYQDQTRNMVVETVLRYVEPFGWGDDTSAIGITSSADAQPIAMGILRFELAFVNRDGKILAGPPPAPADSDQMREFYENLSAIICTVATLDEDSLQKLTPTERDAIVNRLDDAVDNQAPLAVWQSIDFANLPLPARQGLRFHQRYFRLK